MNSTHKEWLTVADLQSWLGLGRSKAYQLVQSGEIPSHHIGRIRRVRRRDVEAWLERNKQYGREL